jgi:hypothetical protein
VFCVRCALALIGIGVAGIWRPEGGSVFVCCYCYWAVLDVVVRCALCVVVVVIAVVVVVVVVVVNQLWCPTGPRDSI